MRFRNDRNNTTCPGKECVVCAEHDSKGSSRCKVKSVIYLAECLDCKKTMDGGKDVLCRGLNEQYEHDIIDSMFHGDF